MANPPIFQPGFNYSNWQATNPTKPLPAQQVDNDFANAARSVNQAISAIGDVRRSDGKLKNGIVGPDALAAQFSIGFSFEGNWAADQQYQAGDGVVFSQVFYAARVSHTSSVANQPPDSGTWTLLFSLDDIVVAGALSMPAATFLSDGATTDFNLGFAPISNRNVFVTIGGQIQDPSEYSVNGNTLTFVTAPPTGPLGEAYTITARGFATTATLVTPADGSVTPVKLASATTALFATAAQGVKADAAMPKVVYDPDNRAVNVFSRANHTGLQGIDTVTSLRDSISKLSSQYYKKRLIGNIGKPSTYDAALAVYGASFYYPQAFCVDETAGQLFITRAPSGGSSSLQLVDVYGFTFNSTTKVWSVGSFVRSFFAGGATSQGVSVFYDAGQRYIALADATQQLSFYNITTLPANLTVLTAATSIAADLNYTFSFRGDVFTTLNYSTVMGVNRPFYRYTRRGKTGTRLGGVEFNPLHTGLPSNTGYQDYIPKMQTLAEGPGFYVGGIGGYHADGDPVTPYKYNGIRLYNAQGGMIAEALMDPQKLVDFVKANIRATANRTENEGVWVLSDGTILSLLIVNGATTGTDGGIFILEEGAKGEGIIDFSSCAVEWSNGFDLLKWQLGAPSKDGGVYNNPFTQVPIANLTEFLRIMIAIEARRAVYYSTDGPSTMIDGIVLPNTARVEISNQNNLTLQLSARRVGFKYDVQLTSGSNPFSDPFTSLQMPAQSAKLALAAASPFTFTATTITKLPIAIAAVGDERSRLDVANNRFLPYAGRCSISATVMFTAGTTTGSPIRIYIYKNGTGGELISEAAIDPRSTGDNSVSALPGIADFNGTTDYVEVYIQHSPAGTKTVAQASGRTFLNIVQA